jgi:serine/threonine protein kinase
VQIGHEVFSICKELGSGQFGVVYLATSVDGEEKFALKVIHKDNPRYLHVRVHNEIEAMDRLSHDCIVKLRKHYDTPVAHFLFMECARGIDLLAFLEQRRFRPVMEVTARNIFAKIAEAIAYSHSMGIAHRDLKLENIMVEEISTGNWSVKIVDWGLCRRNASKIASRPVGSREYCSPELLRGQPYCSKKSDSWMLGVVLYGLLCARFPYNVSELEQISNGEELPLQFPTFISSAGEDLIKSLMCYDPLKRASAEEAAVHRWTQKKTLSTGKVPPNIGAAVCIAKAQ